MAIGDILDKIGSSLISEHGLPALLTGGLGLISGLTEKPNVSYGNSQEYLDKALALQQLQADRDYELAKAKLAQGDGGSAAAGAALAAARLNARVQLKGLQDKALADRIAARLQAQESAQAQNDRNQALLLQQYQNRGQAGQSGFENIARLLQGYRQ